MANAPSLALGYIIHHHPSQPHSTPARRRRRSRHITIHHQFFLITKANSSLCNLDRYLFTSGDTSPSSIFDNYILIGLDYRIPTYPQHKRQRASERERRSGRDRVDQLKRDTTLGKSNLAVHPTLRPRDRNKEGEKRSKVLASWA
jgi:hypothetical protein